MGRIDRLKAALSAASEQQEEGPRGGRKEDVSFVSFLRESSS